MKRRTNDFYTRKSFSLISEQGVAAYNFLKSIDENISELIENHLIFVASKYKTKEDGIVSEEKRKLRAEYRSFILNKGIIGVQRHHCKTFEDWLDYKEKEKNGIRLERAVEQVVKKDNGNYKKIQKEI